MSPTGTSPATYPRPVQDSAGGGAWGERPKTSDLAQREDLAWARGDTGAMTHASSPQVVSVGYEGRSVSDLIEVLQAQDVAVLVDVRLTPISRKPGMSKTALSQALNAAGIGYVHYRELGNPKANRDGYRARDTASLALYQRVLKSTQGRSALRHLAELLDGGSVALLCFERNYNECHRHQVVEELGSLCDNLQVTYA